MAWPDRRKCQMNRREISLAGPSPPAQHYVLVISPKFLSDTVKYFVIITQPLSQDLRREASIFEAIGSGDLTHGFRDSNRSIQRL